MSSSIVANDGHLIRNGETSADAGSRRDALDIREIWASVYRSRTWVIAIFGACLLAAIAYGLLATRLYTGNAMVEVREEAEKVLGTEADREGSATKVDSDRFLKTQLDIIRSRTVANSVAETLRLYRNDKFLEIMDVSDEIKPSKILSPAEVKRELVIKTLSDNLAVDYSGDTRIAVISFTSPDARLSSQIANAYADAFINNNLARKFDSSTYALDFLRDQLAEAQARLEKSEQEALAYARRTRIVDASNAASGDRQSAAPQSLTTAQLVQLNQAYSEAIAKRIQAEQKWQSVARAPVLSIEEVNTNLAIQRILEERALAESKYREELTTRQEDHPAVQQARARIGELDRQINVVGSGIRRSINNEYQVALSQERMLADRLDALKTNTLSEQNQSIELSILRREADTNRQQYDALLRRFNSLNAEAGVQSNNLSIIDRAQVPIKPSWPSWPLSIALSLIAGALFSAAFIIGREQLFDIIRSTDDVEARLRLAVLGAVPVTDNIVAAASDAKTPVSEAFSSIRTNLTLASDHGVPKSMMLTSTRASEGKSSTAYSMARSLARLGKKVLIVDIDLRRPNAHNFFDLPNGKGVSNVLAGQIDAAAAVVQTDVPSVSLMTAGDIPPNPTELIMGAQLPAMIERLTGIYDTVIVDSAPVLGIADAIILSRQVEATIFVIETGETSVKAAQNALQRLAAGGAHVVGAVLTKYDPGMLGYGGAYGYRYEYGSPAESRK